MGSDSNWASSPVVVPLRATRPCRDAIIVGQIRELRWEFAEEGEKFVYRISTAKEWESVGRIAKEWFNFRWKRDRSSGFIHLSKLAQVQSTLQNFFLNANLELYLLQIDAGKLGDGLIYELVDGIHSFPHFYGPSRSFSPLPLDAVTKAEKLSLVDGKFTCSFLN